MHEIRYSVNYNVGNEQINLISLILRHKINQAK